jgi:hypothetical protein
LNSGFDSLFEGESRLVSLDFLFFNRVETSLESLELFFVFLLDIKNYDLSNYLFFDPRHFTITVKMNYYPTMFKVEKNSTIKTHPFTIDRFVLPLLSGHIGLFEI